MERQKLKLIGIGVAVFVVGLALGCAGSRHSSWMHSRGNMMYFQQKVGAPYMMAGMYQMPNGSMMTSGGGMQDMMVGMTTGLEGKTGDAFDKAFLDEMIVHHQGAVDMAKMVLKTSQRQELKDFAQDIIDAQTAEIEMMQEWRSGLDAQ